MTKSRTLMIAYFLFLLFSAALCSLTRNSMIETIAFAATCAGYFFAAADAVECLASAKRKTFRLEEELLDSYSEFFQTMKKELDQAIENANQVVKYYEKFEDKESVEIKRELLESIVVAREQELEIVKALEGLIQEKADVEHRRNKKERLDTSANILMILGFFVFFVLLAFEGIVEFFIVGENTITVGAFSVIIFTYWVRELFAEFDDKYRQNLRATFGNYEKARKTAQSQIDVGSLLKIALREGGGSEK